MYRLLHTAVRCKRGAQDWPARPHALSALFACLSVCLMQVSKLLVYSPTQRATALDAMRHPFFDELRDPACRLPNGGWGWARHSGAPESIRHVF